jgi:autotransporter translocation and assembly factor TamB
LTLAEPEPMPREPARKRRWLRRILIASLGLATLPFLVLGTSAGRAELLRLGIGAINRAIPGQLAVLRLELDGLSGLVLRDIQLADPGGQRVLRVERLRVQLDTGELWSRRLAIRLLEIDGTELDLSELGARERGLGAAVRDPNAPASAPSNAPLPELRVEELRVRRLALRTAELPAVGVLVVHDVELSASGQLGRRPKFQLRELSAQFERDEVPLAQLGPCSASIDLSGPSALALRLAAGVAALTLTARGLLPTLPGFHDAPLAARLELRGLRAQDVAGWLRRPELARAFDGEVALTLDGAGTPDAARLDGALESAAGKLRLGLVREGPDAVGVELESAQLNLARLRPDLPEAPFAGQIRASADWTDPAALPLQLTARSLHSGELALPDLDASGTWTGSELRALDLQARRGQSRLSARGDVATNGSFDLQAHWLVRTAELAALDALAPRPLALRGELGADLRLRRAPDGAISVEGWLSGDRLRAAHAALERARLRLDLRDLPGAPRGKLSARIEALGRGAALVDRASLDLEGGPRAYRLVFGAEHARWAEDAPELGRLQADFSAARRGEQLQLSGAAQGVLAGRPFQLQIAPTKLSRAGVDTRGLSLAAAGQRLQLSGAWGPRASRLRLDAEQLDLAALTELLGVPLGITGRATLHARLSGSPQLPRADVALRVRALTRASSKAVDADWQLSFDARHGRAHAEGLLNDASAPLQAVLLKVNGEARFSPGIGWMAALPRSRATLGIEMSELDLGWLESWLGKPLPATGRLSARINASGSALAPELGAELHASLTPRQTEHPLELDQKLQFRAGRFETQLAVADRIGRWLELDAQLDAGSSLPLEIAQRAPHLLRDTEWQLALDVERRRASEIAFGIATPDLDFDLAGQLRLRHAPGAEPDGHAEIEVESAALPSALQRCQAQSLALHAGLDLSGGHLQASLVGSQRGSELLRGSVGLQLGMSRAFAGGRPEIGAVSAELNAHGLRLPSLPFLCQRVRGELDAQLRFADLLGTSPALDAQASLHGFTLGAQPQLELELRALGRRDLARLELDVRAPGGLSKLSATLPISWSAARLALAPDAPVAAELHLAQLPLAPFLDPNGAISEASGRLSGDVRVHGPLNHPEPQGHLELADAALTATALAQPLRDIQGRIDLAGGALRLSKFRARDGSGELSLDGQAELRSTDDIQAQLQIVAKSFPLRQQGRVVATTSAKADVDARISADRTALKVVLRDSDTWLENRPVRAGLDLDPHPDFVFAGAAPDGARAGAGMAAEGDAQRTTTLSLDASDHFWVKRDDFAVQLSAKLDIELARGATKVTGAAEIHRGYLDLLGRVFDIESGTLTFTGGKTIDPVISIVAQYERRDSGKIVIVKIGGRGSRPELAFQIQTSGAPADVSAGDALFAVMGGHQSGGGESQAKSDASSFVSALTAGLLATSARRELGAAAPILMIDPGDQNGGGRVRAGFELDSLLPSFVRSAVTGVYVEGILAQESTEGQQSSTRAGVLVELYFPHQFFSTGQWGPGTTWSLDWGWQAR